MQGVSLGDEGGVELAELDGACVELGLAAIVLVRERLELLLALLRRRRRARRAVELLLPLVQLSGSRLEPLSLRCDLVGPLTRSVVGAEELRASVLELLPATFDRRLLLEQPLDVLLAVREPLFEVAGPLVELLLALSELARAAIEPRVLGLELPFTRFEVLGRDRVGFGRPPALCRSAAFSSLRASRSRRRRSSSRPRSRTAIASARARSVRFSSSSSCAASGGADACAATASSRSRNVRFSASISSAACASRRRSASRLSGVTASRSRRLNLVTRPMICAARAGIARGRRRDYGPR